MLMTNLLPTARPRTAIRASRRGPFPWLPAIYLLPGICLLLAASRHAPAAEPADPYDELYDAIMTRTAPDGTTHGQNVDSPLLWHSSTYLLEGEPHRRFLAALDAFSALSAAEIEAYGGLKRALLQRHLWAVFDWSTVRRPPTYEPELPAWQAARFTIQGKVAPLLKRLALTAAEMEAVPDPWQTAIKSQTFPHTYDPEDCFEPFLPADLFATNGPWVCLRPTSTVLPAVTHTENAEWRSAFLVYFRLPGGRRQTLDYLTQLNNVREPLVFDETGVRLNPQTPQFPLGTQLALVQRAMLIDDQGEPVLSPLVCNIQLRACLSFTFEDLESLQFRTQAFADLVLQPRQWMQGKRAIKALGRDETYFTMFFSQDPFQPQGELTHQAHQRLRSCVTCHAGLGVHSFNSRHRNLQVSRALPARLREGQPAAIGVSTAAGKKRHYTWGVLETLWRTTSATSSGGAP